MAEEEEMGMALRRQEAVSPSGVCEMDCEWDDSLLPLPPASGGGAPTGVCELGSERVPFPPLLVAGVPRRQSDGFGSLRRSLRRRSDRLTMPSRGSRRLSRRVGSSRGALRPAGGRSHRGGGERRG